MATKDHPVKIGAGDRQEISGPHNFIRLHESTGALRIIIENKITTLVEGQAIVLDRPVKAFDIENDTGADIEATFKLGDGGRVEDSNLAGTVALRKSTTMGDSPDTVIATTVTNVIAAAAGRQRLYVQADDANTAALRVGPAAAAGRGTKVGPGLTLRIDSTAAINVHNDTGVNQTYRFWTEND